MSQPTYHCIACGSRGSLSSATWDVLRRKNPDPWERGFADTFIWFRQRQELWDDDTCYKFFVVKSLEDASKLAGLCFATLEVWGSVPEDAQTYLRALVRSPVK